MLTALLRNTWQRPKPRSSAERFNTTASSISYLLRKADKEERYACACVRERQREN